MDANLATYFRTDALSPIGYRSFSKAWPKVARVLLTRWLALTFCFGFWTAGAVAVFNAIS